MITIQRNEPFLTKASTILENLSAALRKPEIIEILRKDPIGFSRCMQAATDPFLSRVPLEEDPTKIDLNEEGLKFGVALIEIKTARLNVQNELVDATEEILNKIHTRLQDLPIDSQDNVDQLVKIRGYDPRIHTQDPFLALTTFNYNS